MTSLGRALLLLLLLLVLRHITRPRRKLPHEQMPRRFAPRWRHRDPGASGRRLSFRR